MLLLMMGLGGCFYLLMHSTESTRALLRAGKGNEFVWRRGEGGREGGTGPHPGSDFYQSKSQSRGCLARSSHRFYYLNY